MLAVASLWAQGSPASFFSVDFSSFSMGDPLPSDLAFNYANDPTFSSVGFFANGYWNFALPNSRTFDTWGSPDDCARVSFEAGLTNCFAVQTHLTDYIHENENAAGLVVYLTSWDSENHVILFGPFRDEGLRIEGPKFGGWNVLGGVIRDVHLRIEVFGPFYRFFYSVDGMTWIFAGSFNAGNETPLRIGIFSKSWGAAANTGASFADFSYEGLAPSTPLPTQDGI